MTGSPRFSVVVPTRDRPDLLEFCLAGLAAQTCADLEVIVADNPTGTPSRAVFDRFARPGWRYVRPSTPIAMHENFEYGCDSATGEFVSVVIDKTVLHPSAFTTVASVLDASRGVEPPEIVSWWSEGFDPENEVRALGRGHYRPSFTPLAPTVFDPSAELSRRFEMAESRGSDGPHYFRGKIVFGAFSRSVLDAIKAMTGRVFHPLAPDYTSMVPALLVARSAVDIGRPLLVSYNSARSNGRLQTVDPGHARRFIEASGSDILGRLPIPNLYTSLHNVVAFDLVSSANRCPDGAAPAVHQGNLVRRVREDLRVVQWTDHAERDDQYALLEAAERAVGVEPVIEPRDGDDEPTRPGCRSRLTARLFGTGGPFERVVYHARGLPAPRTFASPVLAARAADAHYSQISPGAPR